jgi:hypothetical protein
MTAITQTNAAHYFHLMPSSMPFIILLAEATTSYAVKPKEEEDAQLLSQSLICKMQEQPHAAACKATLIVAVKVVPPVMMSSDAASMYTVGSYPHEGETKPIVSNAFLPRSQFVLRQSIRPSSRLRSNAKLRRPMRRYVKGTCGGKKVLRWTNNRSGQFTCRIARR